MSAVVNKMVPNPFGFVFSLANEARRCDPLLFWVSVGHLLLLAIMLAVAPFDSRTVLGINPWIKPIKFALAGAVYTSTIGWLLYHLPTSEKAKLRVRQLVALTLVTETALVTLQAARGVPSHFNISSLVNLGILGIMGLMIVINTIVVTYMAIRFWRTKPDIPAPYLWGIRLGLLIFLLASLEGVVMVSLMSHSVGIADGGPGLPLINWSTKGGDLRIAHFIGLHALQVLPLIGYLFSLPEVVKRLKNSVPWVWATGVLYGGVALLLFLQALAGRPLL